MAYIKAIRERICRATGCVRTAEYELHGVSGHMADYCRVHAHDALWEQQEVEAGYVTTTAVPVETAE